MASSCYVAFQHNQERLGQEPKLEELCIIMVCRIAVKSETAGIETQTGGILASSCYVAVQLNQERLGLRPLQEELCRALSVYVASQCN